MNKETCIISVGAVTSVGLNAPATSAAVRAEISNFADHPYMINREGDPYVVAVSPQVGENSFGVQRFIDLALPAAEEALYPLSGIPLRNRCIPAILGLPEKRPGVSDELPARLGSSIKELNHRAFSIDSFQSDFLTMYQILILSLNLC